MNVTNFASFLHNMSFGIDGEDMTCCISYSIIITLFIISAIFKNHISHTILCIELYATVIYLLLNVYI